MRPAAKPPVIGILGAGGKVGSAVVQQLNGRFPLHLAGRDAKRLAQCRASLAKAEHAVFALEDAAALAEFCRGCAVIVNCSGPAAHWAEAVSRAALAAGVHCVDVGGDEALLERLRRSHRAVPATVVLAAGQAPGLTGLIPRLLAQLAGTNAADATLICYCGGREAFTFTSALEFAISLDSGYGTAGANWRDGARHLHEAAPHRVTGPQGPAWALPYLPRELERIAMETPLRALRYYHLVAGERLLDLLNQPPAAEVAVLADQIVAASSADLCVGTAWQRLHCELLGPKRRWSCRLDAASGYALTGAVAAYAATRLAQQRAPEPGVFLFDQWANPAAGWLALAASGVCTAWQLDNACHDDREGQL